MANPVEELMYKPQDIQNQLEGDRPASNIKPQETEEMIPPASQGTSFPEFNFFGVDSESMVNKPNWTQRDLDLALGGMYPEERIQRNKALAEIDKDRAATMKSLRPDKPDDPFLKNESGDIYKKLLTPNGWQLQPIYKAAKYGKDGNNNDVLFESEWVNPEAFVDLQGLQQSGYFSPTSNIQLAGSPTMIGHNAPNVLYVSDGQGGQKQLPWNTLWKNGQAPIIDAKTEYVNVTLNNPYTNSTMTGQVMKIGNQYVTANGVLMDRENLNWDNVAWTVDPVGDVTESKRIGIENEVIESTKGKYKEQIDKKYGSGTFTYLDEGEVNIGYAAERTDEASIALSSMVHNDIRFDTDALFSPHNIYTRSTKNAQVAFYGNNPKARIHDRFQAPEYIGKATFNGQVVYLWGADDFSVIINNDNYNSGSLSQLPPNDLQEKVSLINKDSSMNGWLIGTNQAGDILWGNKQGGADNQALSGKFNSDLYAIKLINGEKKLVYKGGLQGK